jgi:hypothetical protein
MTRLSKAIAGSAVEWFSLLALWMAFVSQTKRDELLVGVVAALIGAIADADVKRENFFEFEPKASWVMSGLLLPWYAAQGCYLTLKAFFLYLFGRHPESNFKVAGFDATGNDSRSAAKRGLAEAYLTIPPNSIIIGIDRERGRVLMHEIVPSPSTMLEKQLGVHS